MNRARIEVKLHLGQFGERVESAVLNLDPSLARELMEPMELSDAPFSQLLASPGLYGDTGDCVTLRKRAFKLRRATAEQIANAITDALYEMFGADDKVDGYAPKDWTERDRRQAEYVRGKSKKESS